MSPGSSAENNSTFALVLRRNPRKTINQREEIPPVSDSLTNKESELFLDLCEMMMKRDEVIGEWRKLHNTELQALYSSPDIIRNIKSRPVVSELTLKKMYSKLRATDKLLQILQRLETLDSRQGAAGRRGKTNAQSIRDETGSSRGGTNKAINLEVNPEKTKYMIMPRDQNIVRNGNIKIGNLSFEEVEKFKYLGATVTNINDTREEIKRRINMGNASYYSVEKLLSSSLLSKNLKVRIYKTVILPVVLYGCESWTLTLREEQGLRVFENKVLRKIFGAKRDEVTGEWRKLHNAELHALWTILHLT
ncbi:hypothetical protein ANN_05983 [Periplaneta americana]|uniref:Reverse transcriptase domain-containing protein n=1 Tax=Periplaneta americana TaxID=6978 RepID=A0ABQ8TCA8_PERAM|nr:hypothetical protein ANN_05983 [Periplaneta americana]